MMSWIDKIIHFTSMGDWFLSLPIIFFSLVAMLFIEKWFHNRLHNKLSQTNRLWDDALLTAIHTPLQGLICLFAAYLFLDQIGDDFGFSKNILTLADSLEFGFIGMSAWIVLRFIKGLEGRLIDQRKRRMQRIDAMTIHALCHLLRIVTIIVVLLSLLELLGIPLAGIMSFGAIGGAGVAFAAKDLLSNIFGGLMIFWDRPFTVGDWILSPERDIEGVVEYIGWRLTRVRTFQKRIRYIPNGVFSTLVVENPSRMTHWRIKTLIGLRYDDAEKLPTILDDIVEYIEQHPKIDQQQNNMAKFCEFGSSSLNIDVRVYLTSIKYMEYASTRESMYFDLMRIIEKHGAQIAFPTQTLHIPGASSPDYNAQDHLIKS
jgi:MscS family membrane protein